MAWLSGYSYRKRITIAGSSGAGTGYQVLLKIGESAGSSGADFHLEGHALNFPNDIRFTASDEVTQYSYWIESIEGTSPNRLINVWVKIEESLDTNADIYVYYGKDGDISASNGSTTFEFFDDFESYSTGNIDGQGGWRTIYSGTVCDVIDFNGKKYLRLYANSSGATVDRYFKLSYSGYAVKVRKYTHLHKNGFSINFNNTDTYSSSGSIEYGYTGQFFLWGNSLRIGRVYIDFTELAFEIIQEEVNGTYHDHELRWKSSTLYLINDGYEISGTDSLFYSTDYVALRAHADDISYVDYIYIRRFIPQEPSFYTSGTEEISAISVSFGINSAIYTSYSIVKNNSFLQEINGILKNNPTQLIDTNSLIQKNEVINAQLQDISQYSTDNEMQIQYFKKLLNSCTVENTTINSQNISEKIDIGKHIAKYLETVARIHSTIILNISVLKDVLRDFQKFSSILIGLQEIFQLQKDMSIGVEIQNTFIQKIPSFVMIITDILTSHNISIENQDTILQKATSLSEILSKYSTSHNFSLEVQGTVAQTTSSLVEIISGVLVSHNIPILIELQSEILNHINALKEISSTYSKQTEPIIDIGNDILQSISLALETSSELETKLSEVTEILKQITKKASTKASIDNVIKMNLNILTEIVESASELIRVLRTIGEKASHYYTTLETFLYYRTERGDNNG